MGLPKPMCILHPIMSHYRAHFLKRQHPQVWTTSVLCKFCKHADLSLFCCISTAPQGGIPYPVALPLVVSTSADTGLSPLAKELLALHKSSGPHPSFVMGRGELLWGQWCNSVLLGNSVCCATDAQPRTLFIIIAIIFLLCLGLEEAWKQM